MVRSSTAAPRSGPRRPTEGGEPTIADGGTDVGLTTSPRGAGGRSGAMLGSGPFRRLLLGQAVSSAGDWVGTIALIARAFELTGSPAAVGGVLVLRLVPPLLAAPLGGVLADRFDRRRVMVGANLAMGALVLLVPFVDLEAVYAIAFVSEGLALIFLPARDAAIPDLVRREALAEANGLVVSTSYGAIPLSAALFSGLRLAADHVPAWIPLAALIRAHPTLLAFVFDAASFLFAAAMMAGLPGGEPAGGAPLRVGAGLAQALRSARRTPGVTSLAAGVGVSMVGGGVLLALGITYVHETLGAGDAEFGFLTSLWGVGMVIGVVGVRRIRRGREGRAFRLAVAGSGAVLAGMGLVPALPLAYLAAVAFGAAFATALVLALSIIQERAQQNVRGRLLAGAHMLFRGGLALGALGLGGAVSSLPLARSPLDANQLGLVVGGLVILLGAAASGGVSRAARRAPDGLAALQGFPAPGPPIGEPGPTADGRARRPELSPRRAVPPRPRP